MGLGSACSTDGELQATTTPVNTPSAQADDLFHEAIAAIATTKSLQYSSETFSADGTLLYQQTDEQLAPDRARKTIYDVQSKITTTTWAVGHTFAQRNGETAAVFSPIREPEGFRYPETWTDGYAQESGFSVAGEEVLDGRPATIVRQLKPDEYTPERFVEQIVWIDDQSTQIRKWDVNRYESDGDELQLIEAIESSIWQFDVDISVELPAS